MNVFSIPVGEKYIVYAPLQQALALVNRQARAELDDCLAAGRSGSPVTAALLDKLRSPEGTVGRPVDAPLEPAFLGLLPTRGCNVACRYCDFAAPKQGSPELEPATARAAIDAYLQLMLSLGRRTAEFHFFGGEPFAAETSVHFAVEYAAWRAAELGLETFFEVTTNGILSAARCRWVGEHFDAVVLSLDGPQDIQDRQRPGLGGKSAFAAAERSARLLSESSCELVLRACITQETVERMPEIAAWFGRAFQPASVCFETLSPSPLAQAAGLTPPDPWQFALNFERAERLLAEYGLPAVFSTAELDTCRTSFCPLGRDALILSPEGTLAACYLLPESWQAHGLDLSVGRLAAGRLDVSAQALQRVRALNVENRPLCADCFCRYHCAGGCHVNHDTSAAPGNYDAECIQTRLVTLYRLLDRLNQPDLKAAWLADRSAMQAAVYQRSDRLGDAQP